MTQQPRFSGVEGDECSCGRRQTVRHCVECGSTRIYGYSKPERHTKMNGEVVLVDRLFRCLACSRRFTDDEREWCQAPVVQGPLARLKAARLHAAYKQEQDAEVKELLNPEVASQILAQAGRKDLAQAVQDYNETVNEIEEQGSVDLNSVRDAQEAASLPTLPEMTRQIKDAFLREWSVFKYNGRKVPGFDVYCTRRLKGEIADNIVAEMN